MGDFIIVDQHAGTVKKIGMRSTRLQLLQGEELILSNREATTTSIRNFKKMEKRRVEFSIHAAYDTPIKKLKKIPEIVKKLIEKYDITEFDNIHFTEFGNLGLNFQVVYHIKTGDYNKYLDVQQDINFAIMEAFDEEGIEMGYQTKPFLPIDK